MATCSNITAPSDNPSGFLTCAQIEANWQEVLVMCSEIGGPGSVALADLTDVVLTSPSTGEALIFDGTNWVNAPIPTPADFWQETTRTNFGDVLAYSDRPVDMAGAPYNITSGVLITPVDDSDYTAATLPPTGNGRSVFLGAIRGLPISGNAIDDSTGSVAIGYINKTASQSANQMVQIGYRSGEDSNSPFATNVGAYSGYTTLVMQRSTNLGYQAGNDMAASAGVQGTNQRVNIGYQAGKNATVFDSDGIAIGSLAALNAVNLAQDVIVGHQSAMDATMGGNPNVLVGRNTGRTSGTLSGLVAIGDGSQQIGATNSISIGLNSNNDAPSGASNQIAIGANATTSYLGQTVIGGAMGSDIHLRYNGALRVPFGTTTERPPDVITDGRVAQNAMLRYNTTTNTFEGRAAGAWVDLLAGGGSSLWTQGTGFIYNNDRVLVGSSTEIDSTWQFQVHNPTDNNVFLLSSAHSGNLTSLRCVTLDGSLMQVNYRGVDGTASFNYAGNFAWDETNPGVENSFTFHNSGMPNPHVSIYPDHIGLPEITTANQPTATMPGGVYYNSDEQAFYGLYLRNGTVDWHPLTELENLQSFDDDTSASGGGIPVGSAYMLSSTNTYSLPEGVVKIRTA